MTSNSITTSTTNDLVTTPTIGELQERLAKAKEYMRNSMVKGIDADYAVIPGTGSKPSLLKPGAEKLARLFGLSIAAQERTMLERIDDGFVVAYRCELAGPDGRSWGAREAFAAEAEPTFARQKESGPALLNSLTARAQKRAYVSAVIQAIGLSDLFAGESAGAADLLNETQREIVVAIYEHAAPRLVEQTTRQATKIKLSQWSNYLGAALDLAADVRGWTDETRKRAELAIDDPLATASTVAQFFAGEDGDVVEGELVGEEAVA